jgi:hypothetical protein
MFPQCSHRATIWRPGRLNLVAAADLDAKHELQEQIWFSFSRLNRVPETLLRFNLGFSGRQSGIVPLLLSRRAGILGVQAVLLAVPQALLRTGT